MEIKTRRLELRPFEETDGAGLFSYLSDPEVTKFEPYAPFTREECEREAARRAQDPRFWAVTLEGALTGNIYLEQVNEYTFEIGWVFARAHQHKGYAQEAARAAMDRAFHALGAWRVFALCDPQNAPSWRLCERLGMRREGWMRKNVYFDTDDAGRPLWKDTYQYAILREEFERPEG